MNIREAKEQVKNTITAYFTKDPNGNYLLPLHQQRPLFLMGPPGIGKTAIMEQVASEMNIGLLSYSMTHHTRQSALGLPFISHRKYKNGIEYDVSEYTMSEIIASIYDMMEETGVSEGILFLDEINCVSETLAPVMLQFLQYKVFGKHKVPDGWVVVTAGNPPEYNDSVREFDVVTWDRLKRINIEPSFDAWKNYARNVGIHPSVLTYLDIKQNDFYSIESNVNGKAFVTARGWEDLSRILRLYEINQLPVNHNLIEQYIQDNRISRDFATYYDLFIKYQSDYQIDAILDGTECGDIISRASVARFDERLSLISLLLDAIKDKTGLLFSKKKMLGILRDTIKAFREGLSRSDAVPSDILNNLIKEKEEQNKAGKQSGSISSKEQFILNSLIHELQSDMKLILGVRDQRESYLIIKASFEEKTQDLQSSINHVGQALSNMYRFAEKAWPDEQELLIITTELTIHNETAQYIAQYGCAEYYYHNKELLLNDRQAELLSAIKELSIDGY